MSRQSDNDPAATIAAEKAFSTREMDVLLNIATLVSAASSMNDVYPSFAALVADLIEWDGIIFTTPNDDGRTFSVSLREGADVPSRIGGTKFALEGTLHGETIAKRETQYFIANDGQTAELALKIPGLRRSLLAGFRSFLATPMFSQGQVVGVISIQSFAPHAFTDHDQTLFERIAAFVGPALGRFDAFESLQRDELRNKSLLKIGRLLLGTRDIGDAFERLFEEMQMVIGVDRLTISVAEPDSTDLVDRYIYGVPVRGSEVNRVVPLDSLESGRLDLASHGYIFAENYLRNADPMTSSSGFASYQAGLRSAMFAALRSQGRLVGTFNLKSMSESAYGAADLEYFEQVADHVAASIERTIAHESESETSRVQKDMIGAQQDERLVVDAIRAKERLLSATSQGMRSPLTGLLAFVDLLARNRHGNLDEKQVRYLSIIRRNAEELAEMINSLNEHAEIQLGRSHINLENFEMATMLEDAVAEAAPKFAKPGTTVDVEADDGVEIIGDRRRLVGAIGELIDHGSHYASAEAPIRVVGKMVGSKVEFSVIWPGRGSYGDFLPPAIDQFMDLMNVEAVNALEADRGLMGARAVAVAHGGDAIYDSTPDDSARFTIRIPANAALLTDS